MKKLNIGSGLDYREGFINIDGSHALQKVDLVYDFANNQLLFHFQESSIDFILANDIIEHLFHWEATRVLNEFYTILKKDGSIEIRVPDCEHIIESKVPIEEKMILLFGGQDIPQGSMDESRVKYPQYFCHKYGWTTWRMWTNLDAIGFKNINFVKDGNNFITTATK